MNVIERICKKLIVSCQALEGEPLYGPTHMAKMAKAALEGGAGGIRANSIVDIQAIKCEVSLPLIGIIKKDYLDSEVRITPTLAEVDALVQEGVDIVAMDATHRIRPFGVSLEALYAQIREKYPDQLLMADVSCLDEAITAERLGFDLIATTLVGYTDYSLEDSPLDTLEQIVKCIKTKVVAEGNIDDPSKAKQALDKGAYAVVVGSAITRPQLITKNFVDMMML